MQLQLGMAKHCDPLRVEQPSSVIITPTQSPFVVDLNSIFLSFRTGIPFQNYGQLNVVNTQVFDCTRVATALLVAHVTRW